MFSRYLALLCVATVILPRGARAQSTALQPTTAVRASASIGWVGPAAEASIDRRVGPTLSLGLEHAFTSYLRGLATVTRWQSAASPNSSVTFGTASAELFPVAGTDAYVRAGLGYGGGRLYAPDVAVDGGSYSVAGPALDVGVGYDYHTAGAFSMGAFIAGTNTIASTAESKVRFGTGEAVLISMGLSFRWRT